MRAIFLSILVIALLSFTKEISYRKRSINILFIGNSLTYYNDMPEMLQKMFDLAKLNYNVSKSTFPGMSLTDHISEMMVIGKNNTVTSYDKGEGDTTETERVLQSKNWNYIVLQDGTVRLLIPAAKIHLVIPAIKEIKNKVERSGAKFVFFKTWPMADKYPEQYCYPAFVIEKSIKNKSVCSPLMHSFDEETKLINLAYDTVAVATGLSTVPITDCFAEIVNNYSDINLYEDELHPSKLGAYLNACVFYKYFTGKKASTIKYYPDIKKTDAIIIQTIVDKHL